VTTPVPDLNETRILVPAGALGSGVSAQEVKAGLALAPHGIALDAGSTDSGPARVRVKRVSSFSPSPQRMARDSACRSSMKRPIRNDGGTLLDMRTKQEQDGGVESGRSLWRRTASIVWQTLPEDWGLAAPKLDYPSRAYRCCG
jgi:hypothetical protein